MLQPDEVEEERRLCYVGMTRAMDQLILTRAVYRRRYGTDLPEASVPSRFLEEVPAPLIEELGRHRRTASARVGTGALARPAGRSPAAHDAGDVHYSYEDEDQSASWNPRAGNSSRQNPTSPTGPTTPLTTSPNFLPVEARSSPSPRCLSKSPSASAVSAPDKRSATQIREGTVYQREGEGEEAKITVQFPRFGLKKLVEKYAQLERAEAIE